MRVRSIGTVRKRVCRWRVVRAHERVKARPKRGNRVVFLRHARDFLKLAVQDIRRGEEMLKALHDASILKSRCMTTLTLAISAASLSRSLSKNDVSCSSSGMFALLEFL